MKRAAAIFMAFISCVLFSGAGEASGSPGWGPGAYALSFMILILIALRGFRIGMRNQKRQAAERRVYKRHSYKRERLPDKDDYPSGFGGAVKVTVREPEDELEDGDKNDERT